MVDVVELFEWWLVGWSDWVAFSNGKMGKLASLGSLLPGSDDLPSPRSPRRVNVSRAKSNRVARKSGCVCQRVEEEEEFPM